MASDEEYMRLALAAARKAGNATWRNPRVGSCLVKDGKVWRLVSTSTTAASMLNVIPSPN
ncbi:hypothetical protein RCG42_09005 [Lactobacillus delbrueckii subsp. lactis]|uniref:hypothetical protein n=1 Tax=Lactobacillus delbrueckii TaxID=1584 RepID=UPI0027EC01AB|nr:hypothetical protein [Lactobacillus delbrueckii]MDQ7162121.1 hypothetical protein [Lactobacillus delbrueckii subsp. lactis]MDQ7164117.1 hypothetical protein [Lactobacillus delbrueckii subsp. lactis]MDQ7178517.1 hypothetical protein [Lactobacillus delbrueckii subsp. lactis]MDQ7207138.1 hypothetical protein [Lactobacillus delbrueckii subsp. lactis]